VFAILVPFRDSGKNTQEIRKAVKSLDYLGAFLSLSRANLLMFALQYGGK
jgi:hypothetical protein